MVNMKNLMCDEKLFEKDLSGQTYIVTGANSGAGLATMTQLVEQGAHVVAACRRADAGKEAVAAMAGKKGSAEFMPLDLASLKSVRDFADAFKSKHSKLTGLVNNAGIMATPEGKTKDGFESQFGTNYLGPFLLTELLLDTLKASAPSRVVHVSSVAHAGMNKAEGDVVLDDINFTSRKYDPTVAYCQSKLALVLNASQLAKQLEGTGVTVVSVHPGWIRSNLAKHVMPLWIQNVAMRPFSKMLGLLSYEEGAQTSLHCLLDDDVPNHTGEYYSQNSVLYKNKEDKAGGWPMKSPNPKAYDQNLSDKLYQASREMVGI